MSRVSYVMMNPGGEQRADRVRCAPLSTSSIGELLRQADGAGRDECARRRARRQSDHASHRARHRPDAARSSAVHARHRPSRSTRTARDIGLRRCPRRAFYVGPCIAGHVGADTAAAMLAEGPHRGDDTQLLVDVGTNAEIVLGDRERSSRHRARPGRRSRAPRSAAVSVRRPARSSGCASTARRSAPRFKVIGSDLWSDDPAFAEPRGLAISGVCGSGIIEVIAEMYLAGVIDSRGHDARREGRAHVTTSSPTTARSATCCSDRRGRAVDHTERRACHPTGQGRAARRHRPADRARRVVDRSTDMRLAGAFGAHIDPLLRAGARARARRPGRGVRSVGNAAGAGAVRALLSMQARAELESAARAVDQDRDRHRAAVPGTVRRSDGVPARHSAVAAPRRSGHAARTNFISRRRWGPSTPQTGEQVMTSTDHGTEPARAGAAEDAPGVRRSRASHVVEAETYLTRTMKPFEIVSDEGLEIIEHNAETILERGRRRDPRLPVGAEGVRRRGRRRRRHTRALSAWHVPPDRAGHGAARVHPARPQPGAATCRSAATPRCSRPTTARRSPSISTTAVGTRRSRTSSNFVKLTYQSPYLHHRAARCASRSTCRSASGTSTWCTPTSATATSRSWDRSRRRAVPQDSVEMARIAFGGDLADRTVMTSLINASSPLVWDGTMLGAAEVYARNNQATHHHAVHPRRGDGADHLGRRRRADTGRVAGRHDVHATRSAPARR